MALGPCDTPRFVPQCLNDVATLRPLIGGRHDGPLTLSVTCPTVTSLPTCPLARPLRLIRRVTGRIRLRLRRFYWHPILVLGVLPGAPRCHEEPECRAITGGEEDPAPVFRRAVGALVLAPHPASEVPTLHASPPTPAPPRNKCSSETSASPPSSLATQLLLPATSQGPDPAEAEHEGPARPPCSAQRLVSSPTLLCIAPAPVSGPWLGCRGAKPPRPAPRLPLTLPPRDEDHTGTWRSREQPDGAEGVAAARPVSSEVLPG